MKDLIVRMTLDDVPINCREIAERIGIENLVAICQIVGGSEVYLPKVDTLLRPGRDKLMKEEFNGYNHRELAERYYITVNRVKQICGEGNLEGQVSMLDIV